MPIKADAGRELRWGQWKFTDDSHVPRSPDGGQERFDFFRVFGSNIRRLRSIRAEVVKLHRWFAGLGLD
jgi:hypothetical protein